MTKDFYEFLFDLRASGFVHNTKYRTQQLIYLASAPNNISPFRFSVQHGGNLTGSNLDGEVGSTSEQNLTNLRNMICITCGVLSVMADDCNVDREYAASVCDYYVSCAGKIHTYHDFEQLTEQMMNQYKELFDQQKRKSYGLVVDNCIQYINQNLYSPLRVEMIAKHMQFSPSYLSALFKEKTGQPMYQYIQHAKIEESKKALLYTRQPITVIASALGYHSLSHFSKAFKASTGTAPQQYRAQGTE